jgi:Ca-activated chloride channel homolog
MIFRLVHPFIWLAGFIFLICTTWWRWHYYKPVGYSYPLLRILVSRKKQPQYSYVTRIIKYILRLLPLILLLTLTSRLQKIDNRSQVPVKGIDIIITLDVSGSMNLPYDPNNLKSRFEIAQQEAIKFINKRNSDAIGLVIFGSAAISRCPLTLDKQLLVSIISSIEEKKYIENGTVIAQALTIAANRLRNSTAKNKVVILLTDGTPTEDDIDPQQAIDLLKNLGIKVYTIGIGPDKDDYTHWTHRLLPDMTLDTTLLKNIAEQTGGRFFNANNPQNMEHIYNIIDNLEKDIHKAPIFSHSHDIVLPLCVLALLCICSELMALTWLWTSL